MVSFFLVEFLLSLGFFLMVFFDTFFTWAYSSKQKFSFQLGFLALTLLITLFLLIITFPSGTTVYWSFFNQSGQTQIFKIILVVFALFWVFLISEINLKRPKIFSLYPSLILIFVLVSFLIIIQLNLFGIFICLEVQSILLFAFLSLDRKNLIIYKQVLHYFLLSSFISCIMAMGCAFIYVSSGTLDVINLEHSLYYLKNNYFFIAGTFFLLIGFLFKLGLFPFFYWIPAIFRTVPISGLYASAVFSKIVYFFLLLSNLKFLFMFYEYTIIFSGLLSIMICTILAIKEFTIRGFFGYSSVVQTGFLVFGIPFSSFYLKASVLFYLIIYCVTMFFILFIIMIFERRKFKAKIIYIHELRSLGLNNFFFALCFSIAIFSLAGLPPFPGFFGKLYLITYLWQTDHFILALFLIIYTLFTMFYYIIIIRFMFSGKARDVPEKINGEFFFANSTIFIISIFIGWNLWFLVNHNLLWAIALFCVI